MSYQTKNYTEAGGEKTVIGGEIVIEGTLTIAEGAEVDGLPEDEPAVAANQADSEATTIAGLKEDFNSLLAKLKTAGLMEADTPTPEEPEEQGES